MRLVSWNSRGGTVEDRLSQLAAFAPDIAALQEVRQPVAVLFEKHRCAWAGCAAWGALGTAVAGITLDIEPMPLDQNARPGFLPVRVLGPDPFTLICVWAHPQPTYVQDTLAALDLHRDLLLSGPCVLAGDFNSTVALFPQHATLVQRLREEFGLVSAYHQFFGVAQGKEAHPTFKRKRPGEPPFHIDYVFIPEAWTSRLHEVTVGPVGEWTPVVSDHCPLVVELNA